MWEFAVPLFPRIVHIIAINTEVRISHRRHYENSWETLHRVLPSVPVPLLAVSHESRKVYLDGCHRVFNTGVGLVDIASPTGAMGKLFSTRATELPVNFRCDILYIRGTFDVRAATINRPELPHFGLERIFGVQFLTFSKQIRRLASFDRLIMKLCKTNAQGRCSLLDFEALEEVLVVVEDTSSHTYLRSDVRSRVVGFAWWGWYMRVKGCAMRIETLLRVAKKRNPQWRLPKFRFVRAFGRGEVTGGVRNDTTSNRLIALY